MHNLYPPNPEKEEIWHRAIKSIGPKKLLMPSDGEALLSGNQFDHHLQGSPWTFTITARASVRMLKFLVHYGGGRQSTFLPGCSGWKIWIKESGSRHAPTGYCFRYRPLIWVSRASIWASAKKAKYIHWKASNNNPSGGERGLMQVAPFPLRERGQIRRPFMGKGRLTVNWRKKYIKAAKNCTQEEHFITMDVNIWIELMEIYVTGCWKILAGMPRLCLVPKVQFIFKQWWSLLLWYKVWWM